MRISGRFCWVEFADVRAAHAALECAPAARHAGGRFAAPAGRDGTRRGALARGLPRAGRARRSRAPPPRRLDGTVTGGHHLRVSQSKSAIHSNGLKKRARARAAPRPRAQPLQPAPAAPRGRARAARRPAAATPALQPVESDSSPTRRPRVRAQTDGPPGMDAGAAGMMGMHAYGGGAPPMAHAMPVPGPYGMPGAASPYGQQYAPQYPPQYSQQARGCRGRARIARNGAAT